MGFLDRLAKSLFGKNETDGLTSVESSAYASQPAFSTYSLLGISQVADRRTEMNSSYAASAVAVAELPGLGQSMRAPIDFAAEPSSAAFFDVDFDRELDNVFASLVSQDASPVAETADEVFAKDQPVVEALFADIAANYARPVKNFIFELKRGTATKEWIEICRPAMHGISRAAEGMGLSKAARHMVDFESALSLAQTSDQQVLNGELRELLLWCYEDLIKVMPEAFVIGEEEQQREGIIINSLLMQIPDVGRVTIEKLYRAGLTSLDTLYLARKDELAAATGIPTYLTERICEKFQAYRTRRENNPQDVADLGQRESLSKLVAELRRHHEGFRRASEHEWSNPELASDKRNYRRQRQSCMLWINILLAEVGELDLVNELEKLSFERRVQRLEQYLASAPATI